MISYNEIKTQYDRITADIIRQIALWNIADSPKDNNEKEINAAMTILLNCIDGVKPKN